MDTYVVENFTGSTNNFEYLDELGAQTLLLLSVRFESVTSLHRYSKLFCTIIRYTEKMNMILRRLLYYLFIFYLFFLQAFTSSEILRLKRMTEGE